MWLRIQHPNLFVPVHAMFSADGMLYFRGVDLVKVLHHGTNGVKKFRQTYSKFSVRDLLYKYMMDLDSTTLDTWMVDLNDLEMDFEQHIPFRILKDLFFSSASKVVSFTEFIPSTQKRDAVKINLILEEDVKMPSMIELLEKLKLRILEFYYRSAKLISFDDISDNAPFAFTMHFLDGKTIAFKRI